jgi:hypothetical protein
VVLVSESEEEVVRWKGYFGAVDCSLIYLVELKQ